MLQIIGTMGLKSEVSYAYWTLSERTQNPVVSNSKDLSIRNCRISSKLKYILSPFTSATILVSIGP